MSLSHRPRVTVNGIQRMRTYHYFWCVQCQRTVRFSNSNRLQSFCPLCFHELSCELDISRPRLRADHHSALEVQTNARLFDILATDLETPTRTRRLNNGRQNNDDFGRRRIAHWESRPENGPWITLNFVEPPLQQLQLRPENTGNEIENEIDRAGPPPATASAIEALPTIKIMETHLVNATHCPVCKDELEIGGEARELPCNHLYHSDCIVPWLTIHNTCPVCRYEIKDDDDNDDDGSNRADYNLDFGVEDMVNGLTWLRTQLLSARPLRAFSQWTRRYLDSLDSRTNATNFSREGSSWWPSWFIL